MHIFRIGYDIGFYMAFEETPIAVRPLPWIHPIPPCTFCLFCHGINGFGGGESSHCGAPPFHTPIHYLTSLLLEAETLCHIVGAPPFLVAFARKATPIISGYLAQRQRHSGLGKRPLRRAPSPMWSSWPELQAMTRSATFRLQGSLTGRLGKLMIFALAILRVFSSLPAFGFIILLCGL